VSNKNGSRIGVPDEWLGKKVGRVFGEAPPLAITTGRLVEEVE